MKPPKNQKTLVLWHLINKTTVSQVDVITEDMFWKFNTRLSELEAKYGAIANRKRLPFTNRFGHKGGYLIYSAIDRDKCIELYNHLNKRDE